MHIALILSVLAILALASLASHYALLRHRPRAVNAGEGVHRGCITKLSDAAVTTRYLIVKAGSDANHVAVCSAVTDVPIGILEDEAAAAEENVSVGLLGSAPTTRRVVASAAITAGSLVATTATGTAQTAVATQYAVGRALNSATEVGQIVEIDPMVPDRALT